MKYRIGILFSYLFRRFQINVYPLCFLISGCREIVEEGVTGFLVKPDDAGDLIRAVAFLLLLLFFHISSYNILPF